MMRDSRERWIGDDGRPEMGRKAGEWERGGTACSSRRLRPVRAAASGPLHQSSDVASVRKGPCLGWIYRDRADEEGERREIEEVGMVV
jgi:hypothetical protein